MISSETHSQRTNKEMKNNTRQQILHNDNGKIRHYSILIPSLKSDPGRSRSLIHPSEGLKHFHRPSEVKDDRMSIFVAQVTILHTFLLVLVLAKDQLFIGPLDRLLLFPVRHANSEESQDMITTQVNDQRNASLFQNNKQTNRSAITSWHRRSKILLNRSPVGRRSNPMALLVPTYVQSNGLTDWHTHGWLLHSISIS